MYEDISILDLNGRSKYVLEDKKDTTTMHTNYSDSEKRRHSERSTSHGYTLANKDYDLDIRPDGTRDANIYSNGKYSQRYAIDKKKEDENCRIDKSSSTLQR